MSIWEFVGILALTVVIMACMLDTDWKRKLMRPRGGKRR